MFSLVRKVYEYLHNVLYNKHTPVFPRQKPLISWKSSKYFMNKIVYWSRSISQAVPHPLGHRRREPRPQQGKVSLTTPQQTLTKTRCHFHYSKRHQSLIVTLNRIIIVLKKFIELEMSAPSLQTVKTKSSRSLSQYTKMKPSRNCVGTRLWNEEWFHVFNSNHKIK